jgi:hypothetical protein
MAAAAFNGSSGKDFSGACPVVGPTLGMSSDPSAVTRMADTTGRATGRLGLAARLATLASAGDMLP